MGVHLEVSGGWRLGGAWRAGPIAEATAVEDRPGDSPAAGDVAVIPGEDHSLTVRILDGQAGRGFPVLKLLGVWSTTTISLMLSRA